VSFPKIGEMKTVGKKTERLNGLIRILKTKNGATVKELAEHVGVSEMTIRRDLKFLHENNIVNNVYGATIYNPANRIQQVDRRYELRQEVFVHEDEKIRIGRAAAKLIEPNDVVVIDAGTTTEKMAAYIAEDVSVTILCNSTNVLSQLTDKNMPLIFAGGYYHAGTQMFESEEGLALINRTRTTKAFVSAAGVHRDLGVTCANHYEIPPKKAMIKSSLQKILLADAAKFDLVKSAVFAELKEFNTIITDKTLSQEWCSYIEAQKIKLILV